MVFAATFGSGQVLLAMLEFFLFIVWFWLLIVIFGDIFRSRDLSGWGKAMWSIFVIVLPFIGIFTYLIARGRTMGEHAIEDSQAQEAYFNARVRSAVQTGDGASAASELTQLVALKEQGVINDEEYQRMRSKLVA